MTRSVSADMRSAVFAQEADEEFIVLITIDHADLAEPIRANSSGADVTSRGDTFLAFPFTIVLPNDTDDSPPRAKLQIDNISRAIVQAVRTISSAPSVLIEIVRKADLDTVEASFPDFKMSKINYDANVVEGELTIEEFVGEPYPARVFSPADFPGLF